MALLNGGGLRVAKVSLLADMPASHGTISIEAVPLSPFMLGTFRSVRQENTAEHVLFAGRLLPGLDGVGAGEKIVFAFEGDDTQRPLGSVVVHLEAVIVGVEIDLSNRSALFRPLYIVC
jgi:hypothetical protein